MKEQLIEWRRQVHANPELSFAEKQTAALIEEQLTALGFTVRSKFLDSGLIADFGQSPTVAVRCEMDALPMPELNIVDYRSRVPNVCHACGHDATVACVLGAAQLIAEGETPARIILQPGEEKADADGVSGAQHVINNGGLEGINALLGLHVDGTAPTGSLALLSIPLDVATEFIAEVKAPNIWCKLDMTLSGTRKADFEDIKDWVEKKFGGEEFEVVWRKETEGPPEIDVEQLVTALSFVSRNSFVSKRKSWSNSFSDYSKLVPCLLVLLGCEIKGDRRSQHTGRFDIDEECLPIGASALNALVRALIV